MVLTPKIKDAIFFSTETHEVHQKQKRKGKDIPYITHPLIVGLILARANASEDAIVAGILHDTIEDSIDARKVTRGMIAERFGESVADLVESLTEKRKDLPWERRKHEALEHIKSFSHESLLVKSADLISNVNEILDDFKREGDVIFNRFHAPREKIVWHYREAMKAILGRWNQNPLADDLKTLIAALDKIESANQV